MGWLGNLFKRKPKVYDPRSPKTKITLKLVVTVALLSFGFLWLLGTMFDFLNVPPIGMVLMGLLAITASILMFNMVSGHSWGNRDLYLFLIIVALVVAGLVFGKQYLPDFFSVAANELQSIINI